MCTERKATGLFVLTSFLCDNEAQFDILKFEDIQSKQSKISQNGNNFVNKTRTHKLVPTS